MRKVSTAAECSPTRPSALWKKGMYRLLWNKRTCEAQAETTKATAPIRPRRSGRLFGSLQPRVASTTTSIPKGRWRSSPSSSSLPNNNSNNFFHPQEEEQKPSRCNDTAIATSRHESDNDNDDDSPVALHRSSFATTPSWDYDKYALQYGNDDSSDDNCPRVPRATVEQGATSRRPHGASFGSYSSLMKEILESSIYKTQREEAEAAEKKKKTKTATTTKAKECQGSPPPKKKSSGSVRRALVNGTTQHTQESPKLFPSSSSPPPPPPLMSTPDTPVTTATSGSQSAADQLQQTAGWTCRRRESLPPPPLLWVVLTPTHPKLESPAPWDLDQEDHNSHSTISDNDDLYDGDNDTDDDDDDDDDIGSCYHYSVPK